MKKVLLIVVISALIAGCNMGPSKEARLQKLEAELQQASEKIEALEKRIVALETTNMQLEVKIPGPKK